MERVLFGAVLLAFLAGCNGASLGGSSKKLEEKDTRYRLLKRGYTVDYVDAYELGCASVADKAVAKDMSRYNSEPEYKRGWEQGVATCKNPYGEISRQVIEQKKKSTSNTQLWNEMKK